MIKAGVVSFSVSSWNIGGVRRRREPSENKFNLNFLSIGAVDEKIEPFPVISRGKSLSAFNLIAAVRTPKAESVRISSASDRLINLSACLDLMDCDSVTGVRKVNEDRIKSFSVSCLNRAAYFAFKRAECGHRYMNPQMAGYGFSRVERSSTAGNDRTDFHGLLLSVIKFCLEPLFSHALGKALIQSRGWLGMTSAQIRW